MEYVAISFSIMGFVFALNAISEVQSLKKKLEESGALKKDE
tara:strand:- start:351 stop:473 length:123 start_codon:yes stop_codon:yes gene_type:complete